VVLESLNMRTPQCLQLESDDNSEGEEMCIHVVFTI
jgi:hypothetical protein